MARNLISFNYDTDSVSYFTPRNGGKGVLTSGLYICPSVTLAVCLIFFFFPFGQFPDLCRKFGCIAISACHVALVLRKYALTLSVACITSETVILTIKSCACSESGESLHFRRMNKPLLLKTCMFKLNLYMQGQLQNQIPILTQG